MVRFMNKKERNMTVKELIEELKKIQDDYEVYVKIDKTINNAVYNLHEVVVSKVKAGNGFVDIIGEPE